MARSLIILDLVLQALNSKTLNACVPEYLLQLYNNPEETKPRKRVAKLTMGKNTSGIENCGPLDTPN